jgi:hypothetical protein
MSYEDDRLYNVAISAFMGPRTDFELKEPRDYVSPVTGEPGRTGWILHISIRERPSITLYVDDLAKLWELHDLIAATLPPRTEGGASDA